MDWIEEGEYLGIQWKTKRHDRAIIYLFNVKDEVVILRRKYKFNEDLRVHNSVISGSYFCQNENFYNICHEISQIRQDMYRVDGEKFKEFERLFNTLVPTYP